MKQKLRYLLSISFILLGIIAINTNIIEVNAKSLEEEKNPMSNGCLEGQKYFTRATQSYGVLVKPGSHFPTLGSSDHQVTASITSGIFDVYVYRIIDATAHEPTPIQQFTLGGTYPKSHLVDYTVTSEPQDYAIVFVLKESDNLCGIGENTTPIQKSDGTWTTSDGTGYIYYYYLGIPSSNESRIKNINYDRMCAALRNSNYDAYSSVLKEFVSKEDFQTYWPIINADTNKRFAYCYNQSVSYNYTEKVIAKIVKNKITAVKISSRFDNANEPIPTPSDATLTDSTDFTGDAALQCPAYQNVNGVTLPNKSATTLKYYKTETTTKNLNVYSSTGEDKPDGQCIKTCQETITVTYGPPVASKAGLCFEYKVKVKSEVECKTAFTVPEPQPEDYQICTPTGGCNGGTFHSASGPSDEFDSCVEACDGGKYTQSCINKCYNSVYQTNTTLPLSYTNSASLEQIKSSSQFIYNEKNISELSDELRNRYNSIISSSPDNIGPGKQYSFEDLQVAIAEAGTGYYYIPNNGWIAWNPGQGRYWEILGRYYPLIIPRYTVTRLQYAKRCNSNNFLFGGKPQCGISLIDTNIGILRNNSGVGYCGADCAWYGCTTARGNKYYKGYPQNPGKASNREFLNSADAIDVYQQEVEAYEAAANSCKTAATCSTKTAEFTIKVNNKTNSNPNQDNWIEYATTITENGNLTATTMNGTAFDDGTSIILDRSGCYNQETPSNKARYMTEWSFPGTWVNNKTGKISYEPVSGNAWHVKKNKFCTNLDSKYVNTAWWLQRVLQANTPVSESSKATIEDYNIKATAKDFGYFGWNFDISCFYALYDTADSGNNITDDEKPLTYRLRSIDLKDMFPDNTDEVGITDPTETGRAPGFNWTSKATNVKNSDYEITPGALYSIIQARGNEIYDADKQSAYLDYEFYLTPAELNKIRRYSAQEGSGKYSIYPGKVKVANGVAYYESSLFRGSSSSYKLDASSIKVLGTLGVNNQKSQASNESETFGSGDSYISSLRTSRDEYFKNLLGGNK